MRRVAPEIASAHGPLDEVEILSLGDALAVRDGAIAPSLRDAGLRAIRAVGASNDRSKGKEQGEKAKPKRSRPAQLRSTSGGELPPIRAWRELQVCLVKTDTVRLAGAGKYGLFTALDLGLASRTTHRVTRAWTVLAMTCDHGGAFTYTKFEKRFSVARKHVSILGLRLQALFGIDEPPFEEPWSGVYRSKFIARVGVPGAEGVEGGDG
jgi:hypothetical protein